MYPRWNTVLNCINNFLKQLDKIIVHLNIKKTKRGRPPKHSIREYLKLLIVKEFKKRSLRSAETDYSEFVCKQRVDHSVIHYWEKNIDKELIEELITLLGQKLDNSFNYDYTFIDATEFTSWNKKSLIFHLSCRITKETVYPTGIHYGLGNTVKESVEGCLVKGKGDVLADAWYDDNDSLGVMFKSGYQPIVKSNKERWKGYWRKKARKLYRHPIGRQKYRQRGRGESPFGSLTNEFGDRIKTMRIDTSEIRIGCRIIVYQVKILMRINFFIVEILVIIGNI